MEKHLHNPILPVTLSTALLLLNILGQWNNSLIISSNSAILLILAVLFYKKASFHWFYITPWLRTTGSYLAIIISLLIITWWVRQISAQSTISLDLQDIYQLNGQSLAVLFSLVLLMIALYLFSHRLMLHIATIGLSKYARLGALITAILIVLPILLFIELEFSPLSILLAIFIYIALFDLFVDSQIPGITWFVIWMVLFATCTAALLYRYNGADMALAYAVSYFCCIFIILIFTVLTLYLFAQMLGINLSLLSKPSLRNRIQILVVLLTLFSFAVVAGVTIHFFQRNDPNWQQNSFNFIDTLITLYAFLLLMTGVFAIIIANSITKPIVKVGEKLSHVQLGQNEPLEWKSQDEIGELIAEYNKMIKKLAENTEKLKQSERESAWREMAKQVAHEIKNPLTPIKLSIQYLLHTAQSNPQQVQPMLQRVAQTIIEQIEGLTRIATEFSNFAKMPKPENAIFILNDTVKSVYNLFAENPETDAKLYLQLPENPVSVFADRDQMIRVLNNLIKNAMQAIPHDTTGKIDIILQANHDITCIQVRDNGSGIPPEMREKVFQPNFTTKGSGTGLGLAMCKSIVEAAGGKIWFESEAQQGTTFFVQLPIASE
ncbi:MAG: ATP-binding protein [Saprospiraceae bacterium]